MNFKKTKYFEEQILRKRPFLKEEWIKNILLHPTKIETQENGRIRHWGFIKELGKYLRVVTLEDGETVHNAFPDRDFDPSGG